MGNKIQNPLLSTEQANLKVDIHHSRFMKVENVIEYDFSKPLSMPVFNRMQDWQVQLQGLKPPEQQNPLILSSTVCFRSKEWMDGYLTTLLSLKQFSDISIYNQILFQAESKGIFSLATKQTLTSQSSQIQKSMFTGIHLNNFLDLLIFISKITSKMANIYIPPEEIFCSAEEFFVRSFFYKQYDKNKLILTYIAWFYEEFQQFSDLFENQHVISLVEMDIYLREIYLSLKANKIPDKYLPLYLARVKAKYNYLNFNFDSFQACCRSKKSKCYPLSMSEWLLAKRGYQVYFFNVKDKHMCQGRVIRKKNKIDVEQVHAIFNKEELQINFMLEGTKNMVKTSQFQLQDNFTISDIEIKYKFPLKMRNPMAFSKGKEIFFFDQMVYRYAVEENKLYQESKKINDGIFMAPSNLHQFIVLRLSTDIFRHGIRVYFDNKYDTIYPSGNPTLASEIEHVKIDIKHVQFCVEVYKGVYLILAAHNLWILDLNFSCFFSYSPIQRVKQYYKNKNIMEESEFCFQILNQPFTANWLPHQDNLNVSIQGDKMHTIGSIMGKLFYLQYQFILEAGLLKLRTCQPLFNDEPKVDDIVQICESEKRQFAFSIYSEHFDSFKTSKWIYKGRNFLDVYSMKVITNQTHTDIVLQTEQVLSNLKEIIEQSKKLNKKWSKYQTAMLLHTVSHIFNEITKQNIAHKHFNINNLWITKQKKLKLTGWSEPHRNWYISDYKDYLLTCFNIITMDNSEKITEKLLEKHNQELKQFQTLKQKMAYSLKHKLPQKKVDQQKYMMSIHQSLHKYLSPVVDSYKSHNCIFSFEFNTPRFSMLSISENKIKKMTAFIEGGHNSDQFTFKSTDQYVWNQKEEKLYIFTANYQMLEASVNLKEFKEETVVLEEYQYLPKNIIECSFIGTSMGLFAFGGIARFSKKKMLYNQDIYHFDQIKLTWIPVATLPTPRMQPKLTLSRSGTHVYLLGGELGIPPDYLSAIRFNILTSEVENLIDYGYLNPLKPLSTKQTHAIFHVSEEQDIFLLWITNATNYSFKIFSTLVCRLEIELEGKIYLEEGGEMPNVSIALTDGFIHFLRPYGKYTKISLGNLQNLTVTHKTLYSN